MSTQNLIPLQSKVRIKLNNDEVLSGTVILYNHGQTALAFFNVFHQFLKDIGLKSEVNSIFGGVTRYIHERMIKTPYVVLVDPCTERPQGDLIEVSHEQFVLVNKASEAFSTEGSGEIPTQAKQKYEKELSEINAMYVDLVFCDDYALLRSTLDNLNTKEDPEEDGFEYGDPAVIRARNGIFWFDGLVPVKMIPLIILEFKHLRKLKPEITIYPPEVARDIYNKRNNGEVMMGAVGYYPEVITEDDAQHLAMNGQLTITELEAIYSLFVSSIRLDALTRAIYGEPERQK